jgi:hypothetical protein
LGFEVKCFRSGGDRGRVDEVSDESLEELNEGFTDSTWNA